MTLTWNGVATASAYEVYRETPGAGWSLVATPADTPYTDTNAPVNTTVLYWVQALDADGYRSPESNRDLATTVEFTDSLAAPVMIKAVHIEQLRHAVHEARRLGGLAAYPWTNPGALVGMSVKAAHITQLRTALNEARTALGISALTFADPSLSGVTAKKIHITQLRVGVR